MKILNDKFGLSYLSGNAQYLYANTATTQIYDTLIANTFTTTGNVFTVNVAGVYSNGFFATSGNISAANINISGNLYIGGVSGTIGQYVQKTSTGISWVNSTFNGGIITEPITLNNTTAAISTTTGALTTTGGVGVAGNVYAGGNLSVGRNGSIGGNLSVGGNLYATGWSTATDINTWEYTGKFKSVSAEETGSTGLFFKPDGTKMFVSGTTGIDINEYALSTPWDVSTATYTAVSGTLSGDTGPQDIFFKPDGLRVYVSGNTNDTIYMYNLSSAWDISTLNATAAASFSVAAQETTPTGLFFKPDGLKMYVAGSNGDDVNEYNLSVAWDITTAVYFQVTTTVTQDTAPGSLSFSSDGTKMFVAGTTGDEVNEYTLTSAWNVSTAVWVGRFYTGFQTLDPTAIYIDLANSTVYIGSSSGDAVYQYYANIAGTLSTANTFVSSGNVKIKQNLTVDGSHAVQGTLRVDGTQTFVGAASFSSTLTAGSTITLEGDITTVTSLGTLATTGTLTLGGTTQTGLVTLGRSTGAQTMLIHSGVTATATQKQLILMGNGAAGSSSNLIIGPTVAVGNAYFQQGTTVGIANTTPSTSTSTGALVVRGGVGIAGTVNTSGNIITSANVVTNSFVYSSAITEPVAIHAGTGPSGEMPINLLANSTHYYTPTATGLWTPNVRAGTTTPLNDMLGVGQQITFSMIVNQGATPRNNNSGNLRIDNTWYTAKWPSAIAPTAVANRTEIYTYTLIKTAAGTWVVLGSSSSNA